jgi:hypothetical protein
MPKRLPWDIRAECVQVQSSEHITFTKAVEAWYPRIRRLCERTLEPPATHNAAYNSV